MAGLALAGEVVVTSDGGGISEALVQRLCARGLRARAVESVRPDMFGETPPALVFVGGLREVSSDDEALAVSREAFAAAKTIARAASDGGGVFVTVQDTGGDFGLSGSERAGLGALAGLAKTASLEWPEASVKAIDLERGERAAVELADALADELLFGGTEIEVGLHADGRRTTLRSECSPLAASSPNELALDRSSVIVCSGGGRGVTAATLVELAKRAAPRIALLGRTVLADEPAVCQGIVDEAALKRALLLAAKAEGRAMRPADLGQQVRGILAVREIRATLSALETAGSETRYFSADVTNVGDVTTTLAQIRESWGPISGIIHGAGVVADKLIVDKTPEQFERVLSTKVNGLRALLTATEADPIDTLVLFSSVAARTGNVGQCDYAMANEVLNKVAAREANRRPACVVTSLNWGPWQGGMVTPSLKQYFERHGVPLIPLEVGACMMADELAAGRRGQVEVVLGGPPRRASIAGDAPEMIRVDVRVDADTHPYLADHSIEDMPVLPVVMVLEWFVRAAEALRPGFVVSACRDLRVLRGMPLAGFRGGGDWLRVIARLRDDRTVEVALCEPNDERVSRYVAVAELVPRGEVAPAPEPAAEELQLSPLGVPIYGDALFHGPAFQVIREVSGVGDQGIVGQLVGADAQRWTGGPWRIDPAALDGGLQLAVLWAQHRLGGRGLPTGLGALRMHTDGPVSGPLDCRVFGRTEGSSKAVTDITFIDPQGRVVARLEQVETHQRP